MVESSIPSERPVEHKGSLSITELRATSKVAPAGVYLEATGLTGFSTTTAPAGTDYDPEFHEITYIWTVRTSPLFLSIPLNMPTTWKNPNLAYGKEVFFAFNDAGTYYVDLWAIDRNGITGEASYSIAVANADTTYATNTTICYSETDFTGKPTNAQEVGTIEALNTAISTAGAGADIRVMFRGGETFDKGQIDGSPVKSVAYTSFGSGGRAALTLIRYSDSPDSALFKAPSVEHKIYDLDLIGDWDAVRERGVMPASPFWRGYVVDTLLHRVKISGSQDLFSPAASGICLWACSEVEITNWQNFANFVYDDPSGNKYYAWRACSFHQHSDAASGYTAGEKSLQNAHGPLRIESGKHCYIGISDFFSRNGWSSSYGETADQPCLRLNSNGVTGVFTVLDRVVCENGGKIIAMTGQDVSTPDVPGNYVIDKLLTISGPETQFAIECHFGGTTVRNAMHVEPNIPKYGNGITDGIFAFKIDSGEETSVNTHSPCAVYSSSFFSPITTANNNVENGDALDSMVGVANGYGDGTALANFTEENNVFHAPNQDSPNTTFAPLDTTTGIPGFAPRFAGKRNSLPSYDHTLTGDVVDKSSLTFAYYNVLDKDGNATSQAYFAGRDAGDVLHAMTVTGVDGPLYASEGEFSVSFGASLVTVTNTSGVTWKNGSSVRIKLDHSSLRPALDFDYDVTGKTIPLMRPLAGSKALDAGTMGVVAYDDFNGDARLDPANQGAFEDA